MGGESDGEGLAKDGVNGIGESERERGEVDWVQDGVDGDGAGVESDGAGVRSREEDESGTMDGGGEEIEVEG